MSSKRKKNNDYDYDTNHEDTQLTTGRFYAIECDLVFSHNPFLVTKLECTIAANFPYAKESVSVTTNTKSTKFVS